MPDQGTIGFAYKVRPQWTFMAEYQQIVWGWFNSLTINFANPLTPDRTLYEGYKDSHAIRTGLEYARSAKSTFRLGYLYHTAAAPVVTVTPLLPEGPRNEFTIGYGGELTGGLQFVWAFSFFMPLMNRPGCAPPIDTLFRASGTPHRVGGGTATTCALRKPQPVPPPYINDVAVPGAEVRDGTSNLDTASNPNALTTFFLGGMTQTQMMDVVNPTFVTVWLGNNDVLGAATYAADAGDTTKITDSTLFANRYKAVLDSIDATPASGKGVLIGVANVTLIPFFSAGQTYFAIKNTTSNFPTNFLVGANCAPSGLGGKGDSVLVPFQFGLGLIGLARANPGNTYTLACTET